MNVCTEKKEDVTLTDLFVWGACGHVGILQLLFPKKLTFLGVASNIGIFAVAVAVAVAVALALAAAAVLLLGLFLSMFIKSQRMSTLFFNKLNYKLINNRYNKKYNWF